MVKSLCFLEHMAEGQETRVTALSYHKTQPGKTRCFKLCFLCSSLSFFQELTFVRQLVSVNERVTPLAKAAGRIL